jgi:hypothetical protein
MFPWKDFLTSGTDQENSKAKGGNGQIRKIIKKNKKERMKERKTRDFFMYMEVPILMCSPSVKNVLGLPPLCDPPS